MSTNATATSGTTASGNAYWGAAAPEPQLPQQTLNQDDFLKLLTAQLSSQDPLDPVKDTDFLAQMAQFSSLQQTQNMDKNLASLQAGQAALQAQSLLGKAVQVQAADKSSVYGVVSAVQMEAGKPTLIVNGQAYDPSAVLMVSQAQP